MCRTCGMPADQRTRHEDSHAQPERAGDARAYPPRGEEAGKHRSEVRGYADERDVAVRHAVVPRGIGAAHGYPAQHYAYPALESPAGKVAVASRPERGEHEGIDREHDEGRGLPVGPGPNHIGIRAPCYGSGKGQPVAPRVGEDMLLKFAQAEALFSAKHHDEARKTGGDAGPEPPAGLLPVEEHGKKYHEAGPEEIHHAHLHGLLGAVGKVERQAVADGVDIAHRHAEEEEFLRELPEVGQAEDKEEEAKITQEAAKDRFNLVLGISTSTILLLSSIIYYYHRKKQLLVQIIAKEKSIREAKALVEEKETELKKEKKCIERKEKELAAMDITNSRLTQQLHKAEEDFRMLVIQNKELTRITLMNNFSENAGDIIEKVKKASRGKYRLNDEEWKNLLGAVDNLYPDFTHEVQSKFKRISEPLLRVCYLMKIGLSGPQIVNLTDYPRQTVWVRIKRIEKVFNGNVVG